MCSPHVLLTQMKKDKKKQDAKRPKTLAEGRPSRAKPRVENLDDKPKNEETDPIYYDHTAPWRCGQSSCDDCEDKPSYADYMRERGFG